MKRLYVLFLLLFAGTISHAQEKYPDGFLPQHLTEEEKERIHEIYQDKAATDPPVQFARSIAEFEPMNGALIRYPLGIPYSLVALMSEEVEVVSIVASPSIKNEAIGNYQSHGVNMDNVSFIIAPTNSIWTRDYGPWYIFDENNEFGIVDFQYDRPRPQDNAIPGIFANENNFHYHHMGLVHTGGDFMSTGMGIGASTQAVYSVNSSLEPAEVDSIMELYLGIEEYHVVPNIHGGLSHIDTWAKFLAPDKIMIREVDPGHQYYDLAEQAVAYFESQTSSYGTPFTVYRVYTPNNEPYTNSLILNDRVYVPTTGSPWDDEAVAAYQAAMPGYTVYGVYFSGWWSTDALHCRVREIPDSEMLYIHHMPTHQDQQAHEGYQIDARILPMSSESLYPDSLKVYYQVNGGDFSGIVMTAGEDNWFAAEIPPQDIGSEIGYYIFAADASGRREKHPYIGPYDPHRFTITGPLEFTGFVADDSTYGNNNGVFEPGEQLELHVSYKNNGIEALDDLVVMLSTESEYIDIVGPGQEGQDQLEPGATHTFTFVVSSSFDTPDGYEALFELHVYADGHLMGIDQFELEISTYVISEYLIEEDFGTWLPDGWETTSTSGQVNWHQSNSNHAGGTAPEARFQYNPATDATQRLISPVINTSEYDMLSLVFRHHIDDYSGDYNLKLETSPDGGDTWNELLTFPASNMPATWEEIQIGNGDAGSEHFRIAWTFMGNSWNINYWHVDDVVLAGLTQSQMFAVVEGQLSLNGSEHDVSDVLISVDNFHTQPDATGWYQLLIPGGSYVLTAELDNHTPYISEEFSVSNGDSIVIHVGMQYMTAPDNLVHHIEGNDIILSWTHVDPPARTSQMNKKDRGSQEFSHFNIYRSINLDVFTIIASTAETSFTDSGLDNGIYGYFVTAVYGGIHESQPTDTIATGLEMSAVAELESSQSGLTRIFPNPFGREVTIVFYLRVPSEVDIGIYKLSGIRVASMLGAKYSSGSHRVSWDGRDSSGRSMPNGVYVIRFTSPNHVESHTVVLQR